MRCTIKTPRAKHTAFIWLALCVCVLSSCLFGARAYAEDRRFALLVVNQRGWDKDPFLRYALDGDLRPLQRELRQLGFEVLTLVNKSPDTLRRMFRKLQTRLAHPRKVSTFLFYYSGHADRAKLHMGRQKRRAYSYKEFLTDFHKLPVQRRFAIFDACFSGEVIRLFGSLRRYRQLLREGRLKGVRRRSRINVSQLKLPNQGQEHGLRIITSSLQMSWELNRYKASVFTYHLLRGLRGSADLDRDGKISVDELFDYTSREVQQITGQKPQQLVVTRRARPYALAPAYRSRLTIGAQVVGKLQVAVANFVWSHHKVNKQPLRLSVVHGKGSVHLQKNKQCWKQSVLLPKGGELRLGTRWITTPCHRQLAMRQKGALHLSAKLVGPPSAEDLQRDLALSAGFVMQGQGPLFSTQPGVALDFRWRWLQIGTGFSHDFARERSFSLSRWYTQLSIGYPLHFSLASSQLQLWLGAFLRGGLIMQHIQSGQGSLNLHGALGTLVGMTWWLNHQWGIRLSAAIGADYTPTNGSSGFSPLLHIASACVWTF